MTKDKVQGKPIECTNYFRGKDGKGTCDSECQWWKDGCPCAKGTDKWDGKEHYTKRQVGKPKLKAEWIGQPENYGYNKGIQDMNRWLQSDEVRERIHKIAIEWLIKNPMITVKGKEGLSGHFYITNESLKILATAIVKELSQ